MARFKDNEGREYSLTINVGEARKLKDDLALDITTLLEPEKLSEALADVWKIADAIGLLCESQFAKHGVDAKGFYEALDGDAMENAVAAFAEAVINFFPNRQRAPLLALLAKTQELTAVTSTELTNRIQSAKFDSLISKTMAEVDQELMTLGA